MRKSENKKKKEKDKDVKKDTVTLKAKEYEELKEKAMLADERLEMLARLQAEFENSKKRMEKEKSEFIKFANDELILKLLPVLDNFRRALHKDNKHHDAESILKGVRLTEKQFEDILKEFGLKPIETVGKKFDPHYHEAITHEETDKFEDGIVTEELQKGYLLNDRLLRPSIVKVAKKKRRI